MFNHYYKTGFRNLLRNRTHFFVNITGLAIGFSAFLLIFLVLAFEQSFDNFHPGKDRIYRVVREKSNNPTARDYRTGVPFPVTGALRTDLSQLETVAAILTDYNVQVIIPGPDGSTRKKFKENKGVFFAETGFFQLFRFPLVEGNLSNAIKEPNTAVLTKQLAAKYFGDWRTATGKVMRAYGHDIRITGILDNPPANTDFPLGMVISYNTLHLNMNDWTSISDENYCFVRLRPGQTPARVEPLLKRFMAKHLGPNVNVGYNLRLQPLPEMHFDKRLGNFNRRTFSHDLVTVLRLIGIFLLTIACVNFINLSTASAINRAREIGVRKVLGGNRIQLLLQFFGETGITCLIAMVVAIILSVTCIPFLNALLDIKLSLHVLKGPAVPLFMLATLATVTLLAGFYPALVLSGFNPVSALKSRIAAGTGKSVSLRRALVVLQFMIAQMLIIGTLVVISQINYFRNADLGFIQTAIVTASIPGDSISRTKWELLRNELLAAPGITDISFSSYAPSTGNGEDWATDMRPDNDPNGKNGLVVNMNPADTEYFRLYNLQLLAGRVYFVSDSIREFVMNETAIKKADLGSPEQAVGKTVTVGGSKGTIAGVVKDFHEHSLRDPIGPIVMIPAKGMYKLVNIKIAPGKTRQALAAIANIWEKVYPDYVFEYRFLDESIASYYRQEDQLSQLFKIFAGLAIFISCLGLYGLVSFMASRRAREIGIRKVLGAPVSSIIVLLSREFTLLIALAFLAAAPVAWYVMGKWLQQYTFRINIGAGFFLATLLSSIFIAWLTVGHSAIKAAIANPVKSLRTE